MLKNVHGRSIKSCVASLGPGDNSIKVYSTKRLISVFGRVPRGWVHVSISRPKFRLHPIAEMHKSYSPSGCLAQILMSFPFSIVPWSMNPSPSACNPIFPA